ncbi:uncharacterized protein LOC101736907 isoform X1 [Bombyx mori]|uniref:Uncharacterized protein n=1 Tax=Bombyx mori TaxID=7091 RepID=A0A8R2C9I6_BOMMO|nr:uncharacterized protein LOC101736907 isoform X1 [Bombyx mori]
MSTGRGRGYTGRHQLREPRPGDTDREEEKAVRTLSELSPRATVSYFDADASRESQSRDKRETEQDEKQDTKTNTDDAVLSELLHIDEQYTPLLTLLEQFSPGEDGIQFNRKLRHFETTISSMCPDETRLQQAFATFRAAALLNSVTCRKLAAVGASFTRQQRQQLLRASLLNVVMQGTFSKLDVLERANPQYLVNAANLMGDYFAEARLCNGNKVHILASPLLQYVRSLLASDDVRAHRSLATQLMQNGRELLTVLGQELEDLSISIRLRLLTPPPPSIIWLLLSADLCLNKFLPLPNTLQQFYAAHLELSTDDTYNEVTYGSWKETSEKETLAQNLSQVILNDDAKPKLRPILGAGAGLLRQEQAMCVSQDNFDTWTTKNSLSKRYDLNSWRQAEEEKKDDEPVFNPAVLPPNYTKYQNQYKLPDDYSNYLQQGDGNYIQNQLNNVNFNAQGDYFTEINNERQTYENETKSQIEVSESDVERKTERVNSETQKCSRRPAENWRKEITDNEDTNQNRMKNWKQNSKDGINEEYKERSISRSSRDGKTGRRDSVDTDSSAGKPVRRNVTEVPRNKKYWDHDDRCDKDYSS